MPLSRSSPMRAARCAAMRVARIARRSSMPGRTWRPTCSQRSAPAKSFVAGAPLRRGGSARFRPRHALQRARLAGPQLQRFAEPARARRRPPSPMRPAFSSRFAAADSARWAWSARSSARQVGDDGFGRPGATVRATAPTSCARRRARGRRRCRPARHRPGHQRRQRALQAGLHVAASSGARARSARYSGMADVAHRRTGGLRPAPRRPGLRVRRPGPRRPRRPARATVRRARRPRRR